MKRAYFPLILSLCVLVLVAALCASLGYSVQMKTGYERTLDSVYRQSYFDAMDAISDIESKLSKVSVASGAKTQADLLSDIWLNAELAGSNIALLSAESASNETVIKFLNQLGDYCHYLADKVENGSLTDEEQSKLYKLYSLVVGLQNAFSATTTSLTDDSLSASLNSGIAMLGDSYDTFNNDSSVDYPEMIYDGPFSDGLAVREAQCIKNAEAITAAQAEEILKNTLALVSLTHTGENSNNIPCYVFDTVNAAGEKGTAQVTKTGGIISHYATSRDTEGSNLTDEQCADIALAALETMGLDDMSAVWVSKEENIVYINCAYTQNGVVFYPDLIKLKIAADNGSVLGIEASNYIYNHIPRTSLTPTVGLEAARQELSSKVLPVASRLCLIPTEWNTELLAYEFVCTANDNTYYIYIDANSGQEIKVMRQTDDKLT